MPESIEILVEKFSSFLDQLEKLNAEMDRKYKEAADHYGFHCAGCDDNCCRSRFHHHTFLEYLYIHKGLLTLPAVEHARSREKAREYCGTSEEPGNGKRSMCPLNVDERCIVYAYRPMICRLHGISHELHMPGRGVLHGPGCDEFIEQTGKIRYYRFDRTPFYSGMARLEAELKRAMGVNRKIKMSIAEMLVSDVSVVSPI